MENTIIKSRKSGIIFGLILILLGIVLISTNLGLIPAGLNKVIVSWPMVIIVMGLVGIFKARFLSGSLLFLVGSFLIMPRLAKVFPENFAFIQYNFIATYWPVLLIAIGVIFLIYWIVRPNNKHHKFNHSKYRKYKSTSGFSRNSIFGDGEHIVLDEEFKGGDINAVFGGITLDLRKTNLAEGETVLEANAVFGGITIIVPENWCVEFSMDSIFGGVTDKRVKNEITDKSRTLFIEGACIFGGSEIRN